MQNRFFVWDEATNEFRLLGYVLSLTPREQQIARILLEFDYIKAEEMLEQSQLPLTLKGIPVHIHAINKKAAVISGRKLILCDRGYYHMILAM